MTVAQVHPVPHPESGWPVWGQSTATAELQRAAVSGPAHAYVFAGPPGVGKRLAALELARALCCTSPTQPGRACGSCSPCRRIARSVFPDVTVFDLASLALRDRDKSKHLTLNIATVREVAAAVAYRPAEARWRVVIVDDAETMQETAQEAFLKTLEEPPAYAVIILIASEIENLLATIRSRCVTVRFGLSPASEIVSALMAGGASSSDAERISSMAQGAIGWAFEAANDAALTGAREAMLAAAIDLVRAGPYARMVAVKALADDFGKDRQAVYARLHVVQGVWRSGLYRHAGVEGGSVLKLEGAAADVAAASTDELARTIRSVDACIANLEANVRPLLALETMVGTWPELVGGDQPYATYPR